MVKITNIEKDIKNYLSDYDVNSDLAWGELANRIEILSQNYGFDLKGQPLSDLVTFISLRKMLNPDFFLMWRGKCFNT